MDKRVIGIYENEKEAHAAVEELKAKGYSLDEISLVAKNIEELGPEAEQVESKQMDRVVAGATTGGAIGLAGLFVGLSAIAVPGIGPLLAAGPIFTTLGGAAAGLANNSGSLTKALQETGLTEEEARQYEDEVREGKILVMVSL